MTDKELRDWYAGMALNQTIPLTMHDELTDPAAAAQLAFDIADEMMTDRALINGQPSDPPPAVLHRGEDMIPPSDITWVTTGAGVATRPIGTAISLIEMGPQGIRFEFDKKDGPGRWPDVIPAGWEGPIQFTVAMILKVEGQWYASPTVQYWYGQTFSGGPIDLYARNWHYDPNRWAPLTGHQPVEGELMGFCLFAGNARNGVDEGPVKERSNIVTLRCPNVAGGTFRFVDS